MKVSKVCQECGKRYPTPPKQCMCGWHFTMEVESNDPAFCQYFSNGRQCEELGSVTFSARSKDWYCGDHARMLREESFKR
ncbi:MAG: hypothetical protein A3E85_06090 [Gammaproteobacteria bacterium RIFCSPHIGHO2_12_FULL_45_12]|nr:MAG: hypothetical protein A3E85_06090 [Gammaproteobacteria bacterium RIFCSPHIGHO2_12_FULL_45_12]